MPRVTVTRTSADDIQQRQVIVSIDDGPKRRLAFGDTTIFDVSAGDHELKTNNTLVWKTIKFTAVEGEDLEFAATNHASRFTLGFLALMGVAPLKLRVERRK